MLLVGYFLWLWHFLYIFFTIFQYTISGKKVEVAVKKAIMGQDVIQKGALSNPDSLQQYYNIKELEGY